MNRRRFVGTMSCLSSLVAAEGTVAITTPPGIYESQRSWLSKRHEVLSLIVENLTYQKGVKGSRTKGRADSPFPHTQLLDAYERNSSEAYESISNIFLTRDIHAVDPAGGMMEMGEREWGLLARLPSPPSLGSRENVAELLELFWASALRDVPFSVYSSDPRSQVATEELHSLGILHSNDSAALFGAGSTRFVPGNVISEFLVASLRDWPNLRSQTYPSFAAGKDYLTSDEDWRVAQSGAVRALRFKDLDSTAGRLPNGRALLTLVYRDHPVQHYVAACVAIEDFRDRTWSRDRPFRQQDACVSFVCGGFAQLVSLLTGAVQYALELCWFAKWGMFLFPRPEEVAFWCAHDSDEPSFRRIRAELKNSMASKFITGEVTSGLPLLSQGYPEGAPNHPSYPSGHAVIAGAAITVIKTFLRQDATIPCTSLPTAPNLSVSEQLDLLAWNLSFGRCFAGIHYRSDCTLGIRWGEEIAFEYLRSVFRKYRTDFSTTIRRFSGEVQTINA